MPGPDRKDLGRELHIPGSVQLYRPRQPYISTLWQCLKQHFDAFCAGYEARFQPRYGFLRPIIPEVVGKRVIWGD